MQPLFLLFTLQIYTLSFFRQNFYLHFFRLSAQRFQTRIRSLMMSSETNNALRVSFSLLPQSSKNPAAMRLFAVRSKLFFAASPKRYARQSSGSPSAVRSAVNT